MNISDTELLYWIVQNWPKVWTEKQSQLAHVPKVYPLDEDIQTALRNLHILLGGANKSIFSRPKDVKDLWQLLLEKSIICLRFYDSREPYTDPQFSNKTPQAYGLDALRGYFDEFSEFESILYGSSSYYRDHVIHVFRTWMIGVYILLKKSEDKKFNVDSINIYDIKHPVEINFLEILSIWTVSALVHDLGYPLEKFQLILDKTQKMMRHFIFDPQINQNFNFNGTQDSLNNFIVRLASSKMHPLSELEIKQLGNSDLKYKARLQSKYYFKFSKSLEKHEHGILSAVIVYKSLLYFLESDFNLNEDYYYKDADVKQFYIRREILRAIASHTCDDIYHLYSNTISMLLIISDDLQEWGRMNWSEFYQGNEKFKTEVQLKLYTAEIVAFELSISEMSKTDFAGYFNGSIRVNH